MAVNGNQYDPNNPNGTSSSSGDSSSGSSSGGTQDNFMSQPINISGASAADPSSSPASSPTGGSSGGSNPKATSSGSFQNLNAYLRANQNFNQAGGGLAGQINQNLTSQSNDLQKNFAQAQTDYQTSLQNAQARYSDPNYVNTALQNTSQFLTAPTNNTTYNGDTYRSGTDANGNAITSGWYSGAPSTGNDTTNPTTWTMDPNQDTFNTGYSTQGQNNINQFDNYLNASYNGPTSLDPDQSLQAQADNFSQLAGNAGTEQGRFNLLNQIYNNNNYSQGQQTLDNLFLQSNPSQIAQLQNSAVIGNQLENNLGQANASASSQAIQAAQNAQNVASNSASALNNSITGFDTGEQQNVTNALNNQNAAYQTELGNLQSGKLNTADATALGIINSAGQSQSNPLFGLNLGNYISENTIAPTAQTVASSDDYNKIQALANLANSGNSVLNPTTSGIIDSYNDPTQAGAFAKLSPYTLGTNNTTGTSIQNDLGSLLAGYNNQANPLQGQLAAYNADLTGGGTGLGSQYQGGEEGQIATRANQIRQQLSGTPQYQMVNGVLTNVTPNYTNMSDNQILSQYGNGGNQVGQDAWLLNAVQQNQQGATNSQAALNSLMQRLGYNDTASITDASQYAPTSVANPTGTDVNTSSPSSATTMAALNKLYGGVNI